MPKIRHFVLVEPFRKADVTIFESEALAVKFFEAQKAAGKQVRFMSQTGTVNDLGGVLASLREELAP